MLTDLRDLTLHVYVNGVPQKTVTNVAAVSNGSGVAVLVRGILKVSSPELSWLESDIGEELDLIVLNKDGVEITEPAKLVRKTLGHNVQGKHPFWHVRLELCRAQPADRQRLDMDVGAERQTHSECPAG